MALQIRTWLTCELYSTIQYYIVFWISWVYTMGSIMPVKGLMAWQLLAARWVKCSLDVIDELNVLSHINNFFFFFNILHSKLQLLPGYLILKTNVWETGFSRCLSCHPVAACFRTFVWHLWQLLVFSQSHFSRPIIIYSIWSIPFKSFYLFTALLCRVLIRWYRQNCGKRVQSCILYMF